MLDRLFLPFIVLVAILMISLAMVWPQGLGDRSPGQFGHTPLQQTPAMKAAMKRETEAAAKRSARGTDSATEQQTQAIAPTQ